MIKKKSLLNKKSNISFLLQYQLMDNIYLDAVTIRQHSKKQLPQIINIHFQSATQTLLLLHPNTISIFTYIPKQKQFQYTTTFPTIEELQQSPPVMIQWLAESQCVLVATKDGNVFTIDRNGQVQIKAQNEDGLVCGSVNPSQDYIYLVTKNHTIVQLNKQCDLINEIAIDDQEEVVQGDVNFTWRNDGSFFSINYQTKNGRKAVTRDQMMGIFISPAKSDSSKNGQVHSVSEIGKPNMQELVAWQPSGSVIAGVDFIQKGQEKQYRVIFWQKNGLRHLEFVLPRIQKVTELFWSTDSNVLFVRCLLPDNSDQLFMYYRANYKWFLKNSIKLDSNQFCIPVSGTKTKQRLLIVTQQIFQLLQYALRLSQKSSKNAQVQAADAHEFHYFVDGPIVHATDFSKCMMPPPMSMQQYNFGHPVTGTSKLLNNLLVITTSKVYLWNMTQNKVIAQAELGDLQSVKISGLRLFSSQPLRLANGEWNYSVQNSSMKKDEESQPEAFSYKYSQDNKLKVSLSQGQLTVNQLLLTQECTSYALHYEFFLFTVATSDMYDKLYVINLQLDQWLTKQSSKPKQKLDDYHTQQALNHRLIERGGRIVGLTRGKVVLQLPRGNLQGIYPKVIAIAQVAKYIAQKKYLKAFQTIRTHKLDFNLLCDINAKQFTQQIEAILLDLKRQDFINLFISQITQTLSTQLKYVYNASKLLEVQQQFELYRKGNKIRDICRIVSSTLRKINKQNYILSIFTSEIREGKIKDVLFQIQAMKQNDIEVVIPPHLNADGKRQKKKRNSQDILEYVCWLVDANSIYEAALLTYDLELTAMTARCTQKDPKQYIPYLEGLKAIKSTVQFRKKICLDLKRYDIAVKELSQGTEEQIQQSLQLIKKHKLFKNGLTIYSKRKELRDVKGLIVEELLTNGQNNEAYRMCQSIGDHARALEIAKQAMDTVKIQQCLRIIYSQQQAINEAKNIINLIQDGIKDRGQLARLYAFIGNYQQAITLYLRHNQYREAYKYIWKVSQQFKAKEMTDGFKLCFSIKKNQITKDRKQFLAKYQRLLKVHKSKAESGEPIGFKARQNQDMYSQVSMSSRSGSNYTMSTTTGMRKKKDKKRSILTRNVKEGSMLEQQYLIAHLKNLQSRVSDAIKDSKLLIQHLICMNLIEEAQQLRDCVRQYIQTFQKYRPKSFACHRFEETHPQAKQLYFEEGVFSSLAIDSFNYLF